MTPLELSPLNKILAEEENKLFKDCPNIISGECFIALIKTLVRVAERAYSQGVNDTEERLNKKEL